MKSWSSWWTAIVVVLVAQLSCGGESDERPSGSSGASSGKGGSAGASAAAGKGGKSGSAGSSSAGRTAEAGEGGEAGLGAGAAGGRVGNAAGASVGGSGDAGRVGTGGTGAIAGGSGSAGTGGKGSVPFNWYCAFAKWGDGECDCGCGVRDTDCEDFEVEDCDTCNSPGSCNGGECPGRVNPENPAVCTPPPEEWTCPDYAYWDFMYCDCGCGVPDPDCEGEGSDQCDKCNLVGSCSGSTSCPGSIDAEDNSKCDIPEGWNCSSIIYLDNYCDCGCGVVDGDCVSPSADVCENCWNGCAQTYCPGPIDAENNAVCTGVPVAWRCGARFYDDGAICNCGCGAPDPDCENDQLETCERCDAEGSCSARGCPGTIDPEETIYCVQPPPPEGWTCGAYAYADGDYCDCGCGVEDLDCRVNDIDECERCSSCGSGSCPGRVNQEDPTDCIEPPPGWQCDDNLYGDGYNCTCGCGAPDPDCPDAKVESCTHCPTYAGSCSEDYYCEDINPEDNSRCNPTAPEGWACDPDWYGDRACDCGCGIRDLDCESASSSVCELCDGESCSPPGCAAIDPADNAVCTAG